MSYPFNQIEQKWQNFWSVNKTFSADNNLSKPKYYVLDMFPYPSGAGLHVGHPLGYIAGDITARYKRLKGFNVLHPMGYDSFGLPAEQYAIQTGQHPAITTENNIRRYREQLDKLGFSFDWSREVRTSDPSYYKWTQWIFTKLFNSWYNPKLDKAESLDTLIQKFRNKEIKIEGGKEFDGLNEKEKSDLLMNYRLAYLSEAWVNWCPQLGTVLANEEVKDGVSERGGYPVERKLMPQWSLRITAYAERLLQGLEKIDWSESLKESQRYWIGRSEGSSLRFKVENQSLEIEVFTTRPDTIFGVTFLTLAPESDLVSVLTTPEQKQKAEAYIHYAKNRSERERQADVKKVTGEFTGSYCINPFNGKRIPIWIGEYVLAGYGTGAVMGVPSSDERDGRFAKQFGLDFIFVIEGTDKMENPYEKLHGKMINSDFLNSLDSHEAIKATIKEIEKRGLGKGKIQYRLRDAIFGRQRYWGEPIPIYYKEGIPYLVDDNDLPVVLPEVDKYLPTESGEPPLARAKDWKYKGQFEYEKTTMPGWAGSSWYYLRYMDAHNDMEFADKQIMDYWKSIDLYIGGNEHATGHLLYVRFWTKFLNDLEYISISEPAKKLINQGMIQGTSCFVHRINGTNKFVSSGLKKNYETIALHVDVNIVDGNVLNIEQFKNWREEFKASEFILEDGKYICSNEVEKMSKSKWNVVSPDMISEYYGADTLRMYEMFLGPLEMSKPWNTNGISGVFNFLNRFWRLFHKENPTKNPEEKINNPEFWEVSDEEPSKAELKVLHKTIKKIQDDIENFSFNTAVSAFMICINELLELKCNKRKILDPLVILLSPFAPHIAEELWNKLGYTDSISFAAFPVYVESYTMDASFAYPVSFNGKMRFNLELPLTLTPAEIEKEVLAHEQSQKYMEGKKPKKIIVVPKRIVNIVI